MTQNMTHGDILDAERNGRPEGEVEILTCHCCHEERPEHQVNDMRICDACQTAADDRTKLRKAVKDALSNLYFGEESVARARLIRVLQETK